MKKVHFSPIMLVVLALGCVCTTFAAEEGLVGWWRFDEMEDATVKDSGPHNFPSKVHFPENVELVEGKVGKAIKFTGESVLKKCSSVGVPGTRKKDFKFTEACTVEAWIKFRSDHKRQDACFIAHNGPFKGPGWRFLIAYGRVSFQSGDGDKMWGANSNPAEHGKFENGRWYHVAGVWDGSAYRVYLDGVEAGITEDAKPMTKGTSALTIGAYGTRADLFKGSLDEVKIYNRAKSALEIAEAARVK